MLWYVRPVPVEPELRLRDDDPLAVKATAALQAGDVRALGQLLAENPELALARIETTGAKHGSRTLLRCSPIGPVTDHMPARSLLC